MLSGLARRSFRIPALLLAASGVMSGFTILYSTGIVGVTRKPNHVFAEPGCFCHGDTPGPGVSAWIEGPETLGTGETALYSMHVARDSSVAAGFNVAAFFGSLGLAESTATQLAEPAPGESPEITHLMPRAAGGRDTISWSFLYRAPFTAGLVDTLYSNGNSVDLSGDPAGDRWAFSPEFLVYIVPPSGVGDAPVAGAYRLHQNYPNPFNGETKIGYRVSGLGSGQWVRLSVYDLLGREVATLVNERQSPGEYTVRFDAGSLSASGVYLYRLLAEPEGPAHAGQMVLARKMVVLK